MLKQITKGVLVHQSSFCQSNTVVVQDKAGAILIDPGITAAEMACIANDLRELGQTLAFGFSTHPHWDHLLWDAQFGAVPRYGTAVCAALIQGVLSQAGWQERVRGMVPADLVQEVPLDDIFGQISGLPNGATHVPWSGPNIQVIEHQAHAAGHAALLVEQSRVLVAGDMLSDVLVPILNFNAANPIEDYLSGLEKLEALAGSIDHFIPGHGSAGGADQLRARIEQDRAYVQSLEGNAGSNDPRLGPSATYEWVRGVHERQLQQLTKR